MQFKCRRNLSIAARIQSEHPDSPRMSPDVPPNRISRNISIISIPPSFRLIPPEIPSGMWLEFWKFFIPAGSAWFLLIRNKCDGVEGMSHENYHGDQSVEPISSHFFLFGMSVDKLGSLNIHNHAGRHRVTTMGAYDEESQREIDVEGFRKSSRIFLNMCRTRWMKATQSHHKSCYFPFSCAPICYWHINLLDFNNWWYLYWIQLTIILNEQIKWVKIWQWKRIDLLFFLFSSNFVTNIHLKGKSRKCFQYQLCIIRILDNRTRDIIKDENSVQYDGKEQRI